MSTFNIHEAKTHFSKLIESVQQGEQVIISKAGKPVAVLGPITKSNARRVRGFLKDQIHLGPEFDDPLPVEILAAFEGNT